MTGFDVVSDRTQEQQYVPRGRHAAGSAALDSGIATRSFRGATGEAEHFIIVEAPEPQSARMAFETALGAMTRAAQTLWAPRGGVATASESPRLHPVQNPAGVALPGARWFRARAVEIETEQPVELTLDGELRGRTPAVARVAPGAVRVIVPASAAAAR